MMKSLILSFCLCSLASIVAGQLDISTIQRCANLALRGGCINARSTFIAANRAQLNNAVTCNSSELAVEVATACTREMSSGLYCGAAPAYLVNLTVATAACEDSTDPANNCTDECRNNLTTLRRELGCCINSVFNTSDSSQYEYYIEQVFTYPLWSKCGVETVTSGGCPGRLHFDLRNAQRTCNYSELQTVDLKETCTSGIINEVRDTLSEQSCDSYLDFVEGACAVDRNNTRCLATDSSSSDFNNYVIPLYMNGCTDTRLTCSDRCRGLLQGFTSNRGCCINALYNSTFGFTLGINQNFLRTPEIFTHCGVRPPPTTCMSGIVATGGAVSSSLGNIAVILLLLFVVGLLIR